MLATNKWRRTRVQEAIETLVVRIVEEKAEGVVLAAVEPPDAANFPEPADFLTALDAYLSMLPAARDVLREAIDAIVSELPVKAAAEASLEGLFAILQVRPHLPVSADDPHPHYPPRFFLSPLVCVRGERCFLSVCLAVAQRRRFLFWGVSACVGMRVLR